MPLDSARHKTLLHVLFVIAVSGTARLAMAVVFPILIAPDSAGYIDVARMIVRGDFSGYDGSRTPLYPLLIALAGFGNGRVVLVQHTMGVLTAVWVYFIFLRITGRRGWSLAAALVAGLNTGMIAFERAVLTESLTALLLTATVLLFLRASDSSTNKLVWLVSAGVLSGLAALARPAMIYLPVLLGVLVLWRLRKEKWMVTLGRSAAAALPGILLIVLWSGFNYRHTGYFLPSTVGGIGLINHTGAFIEDAPPEYDQIKRIYLAYRARQLAERGNQRMTVYLARQELMDSTGLNSAELDARLRELSLSLILRDPLKYGASVCLAFALFWRAAWYTNQGGIAAVLTGGSLPMRLFVGGYLLIHTLLTVLFLVMPVARRLWTGLGSRLEFGTGWLTVYAVTLTGALLQALIALGENPRYGAPFEPLVLPAGAVVLLAAVSWAVSGRKPAN